MYNKIVVQDLVMNVLVEYSKMFEMKIGAKKKAKFSTVSSNSIGEKDIVRKYTNSTLFV